MKYLLLLIFLLAPELDVPYKRDAMYGGWIDADNNCMSTRHEVLKAESLVPPTLSDDGCRVLYGLWYDPYTGLTFTSPRKLDIDHLVPLKEAHQSGGVSWTKERRVAYANDLDNAGHLIAVEAGANRQKGYKDPSEWLPPNESFHCAYVKAWLAVKEKWRLTIDVKEMDAIKRVLETCDED